MSFHFMSCLPSPLPYPYISEYKNFCGLPFSLGKIETKTSQEPAFLASRLPAGETDVVVEQYIEYCICIKSITFTANGKHEIQLEKFPK